MPGIRGVIARIEWSYYVAASLHGYAVTCDATDRVWRMRATLIEYDAFKLTQRPLRFVAPHSGGTWTWPIESLELVNGSVVATLGTPWTQRKDEA